MKKRVSAEQIVKIPDAGEFLKKRGDVACRVAGHHASGMLFVEELFTPMPRRLPLLRRGAFLEVYKILSRPEYNSSAIFRHFSICRSTVQGSGSSS